MLVVKNTVTAFAFAVLYGLFCGACEIPAVFVRGHLINPLDIGISAPMVASLAKNELEIGARMGICFAVNGMPVHACLQVHWDLTLNLLLGIGGLIGST